jgi:class 3 adenylate cyclase
MINIGLKTRRTIYALAFAIIILGPIFFIKSHLEQGFGISKNRILNLAKKQLVDDMQDYQNDLDPVKGLKSIINNLEVELGIISTASLALKYQKLQDPKLITEDFTRQVLKKLKQNYSLTPLCILGTDCDVRDFFYWFSPEHFSLTKKEMYKFCRGIMVGLIDEERPVSFLGDAKLPQKFYKFHWETLGDKKFVEDLVIDLLKKYISNAGFLPARFGLIYSMASSRFGADKIFWFPRVLFEKQSVLGGYSIFFTNMQVLPEILIKFSREGLSQSDVSRAITETDLSHSEQFFFHDEKLVFYSPVPSGFLAHLAYFSRPELKKRLKKSLLSVSLDYHKLVSPIISSEKNLNFLIKLFVLLFIFVSSNFILFGFPMKLRLRSKMIAVASLMVLIPCILLGYFSGRLIDQIEKLKLKELQIMSQQKLYEIRNFIGDMRYIRMLGTQKLKIQLSKLLCDKKINLETFDARLLKGIREISVVDLYSINGQYRRFNYERPYKNLVKTLQKSISVNYLNRLGVADKNIKAVKRDFEKAMLAGGFLENFSKGFVESKSMKCEAYESPDLMRLESLARMTYFLIHDPKKFNKILGISFIHFDNMRRFGSLFVRLNQMVQKFFINDSDGIHNEYLLGARKGSRRFIKSWVPESFYYESPQRKLLDSAAEFGNSGSFWQEQDGGRKVYSWQSFTNDSIVIGGSSFAKPDKLISLLITLLPFALLIFSLISLFILGDILSILLVNPIKGFIKAVMKVRAGNYETQIVMANTDEFSQMSDSMNQMVKGLLHRERMKRFVSDQAFESVENSEENLTANKAEISILVSDIRGFTTISEQYDPVEIVNLLNDYFTEMEDAIVSNKGKIDRFVGDAIIAVFDEDNITDRCCNAVKAALVMRKKLKELNNIRKSEGKFQIENGVGIATGIAVCGPTGKNSDRMDFAVVGDLVGKANELEALAKQGQHSLIIVCEKTSEAIKGSFSWGAMNTGDKLRAYEVRNEADNA